MAEVLSVEDGDDLEAAEFLPVTVFHPDGAGRPVIFVRSWLGELAQYRRLARALGPDQPVYTVAPPAGDTAEDYPDSVEEWAGWLLDQCGADPFRGVPLGGHSFGGIVALELARLVGASSVPRLVMVDTSLPRTQPRRKRSVPHRVLRGLSQTLDHEPGDRLPYFNQQVRAATNRATRRLAPPSQRSATDGSTEQDVITSTGRRMPLLKRTIWTTYLRYEPRPIATPASIFRTSESVRRAGDPALGWLPWFDGSVEIVPISGGHIDVMGERHVAGLAAALRRSLDPEG